MTNDCCEMMRIQLETQCPQHPDRDYCPDAVVGQVRGGYGLLIHDGENDYAGSVIEIAYCPWCGNKLPKVAELDISRP